MTLIKCKSKIDASCSFEKDGMKCGKSYKIGEDYLYNPDLKKGYCCSHEELNANVTQPTSKQGGGWKGGSSGLALCRSPQEALDAIIMWDTEVMPKIDKKVKELSAEKSSPEQIAANFRMISTLYEEIFLGKFTPSQIAK